MISPARTERWRFIDSGFVNGLSNMAIDEAIARQCNHHDAVPTLRVYGWRPPAISLGFHQKIHDVNLHRCKQESIDVVIRPTGGRAVLHADELTYSVILSRHSRFYSPNITLVYERISFGILKALENLNIHAAFERAQSTPKDFARGELSTLCYASSVQHEIGYKGRKLVGSAQRRLDGVVLQHGSILIGQRHLDITDYLTRGNEKWRQKVREYMEMHTVCLRELSDSDVTFENLAGAMKQGFERAMNIEFIPGELSESERALAESLREQHAQDIQQKLKASN